MILQSRIFSLRHFPDDVDIYEDDLDLYATDGSIIKYYVGRNQGISLHVTATDRLDAINTLFFIPPRIDCSISKK